MVHTHTLNNLNILFKEAIRRKNTEYEPQEIELTDLFKQKFSKLIENKTENKASIQFFSSFAIFTNKFQQQIFIPNQWFILASYMANFCSEVETYRRYFILIATEIIKPKRRTHRKTTSNTKSSRKSITPAERLKNYTNALCKGSAEDKQEKKEEFMDVALSYLKKEFPLMDDHQIAANYLWRFATDYDWWSGSKTIDRNDYMESAILDGLNLVHVSSSFVKDICCYYISDLEMLELVADTDIFTVGFKKKTPQHSFAEKETSFSQQDRKEWRKSMLDDENEDYFDENMDECASDLPASTSVHIKISSASLKRFKHSI